MLVFSLTTPQRRTLFAGGVSKRVQTLYMASNLVHHLTIAFKPSQEEVENMPLGKPVKMKIIGYGQDEKAQAVFVQLESGIRSNNAKPHITMAISPSGAERQQRPRCCRGCWATIEGIFGYSGKVKTTNKIAWESA